MKLQPARLRTAGIAVAAVLGALRVGQALLGVIPGVRAASEIAVVGGAAIVGWLAYGILGKAGTRLGLLVAVLIIACGGAILFPLWSVGHPPAPLYSGMLGPDLRRVVTTKANRGRYSIDAGAGESGAQTPFWLRFTPSAGAAGYMAGQAGAAVRQVWLRQDESLELLLERFEAPVRVEVRAASLPSSAVAWAALLVAALAIICHPVGLQEGTRRKGAFAAAIGGLACLTALLAAIAKPSGAAMIACLLLAAMAGVSCGAAAILLGRFGRGRAR